jgi:RNA processing factor Prp31
MNEKKEMTEPNDGQILEMSNHLKELYDVKEKELEKLKEENLQLKKVVMSCYGVVRILDQQFNNILLDADTNSYIIEALRSYLSNVVEYEILDIENIL